MSMPCWSLLCWWAFSLPHTTGAVSPGRRSWSSLYRWQTSRGGEAARGRWWSACTEGSRLSSERVVQRRLQVLSYSTFKKSRASKFFFVAQLNWFISSYQVTKLLFAIFMSFPAISKLRYYMNSTTADGNICQFWGGKEFSGNFSFPWYAYVLIFLNCLKF